MSDTILTFDNLKDYPYNSFTDTLTPIPVGYSGADPEVRTIPASTPYIIQLFNGPIEDSPSTFDVTVVIGSVGLTEVPKGQAPGINEYRVNYDAEGIGQVEFNSSRASQQVSMKYYHKGTIFSKTAIWAKLLGINTITFASSDSQSTSIDIADQVIDTSEDAALVINAAILAMATTGGTIKLFEGTYNLDTRVILNQDNVIIEGSGRATKLFRNNVAVSNLITISNDGNEVKNIHLDGNRTGIAGGTIGIQGDSTKQQTIKDVYIYNCETVGIDLGQNVIKAEIGNCGIGIASSFRLVDVIVTNSLSDGFFGCFNLVNCKAKDNAFSGFVTCIELSNCEADSNDTGFGGCDYITGCLSKNNTGLGGHGYESCEQMSACKSQDNGANGFEVCFEISSCYSFQDNKGYVNCARISSSRSQGAITDGFSSCNNVTGCYSAGNGGNGFVGSKSIGFNDSNGNTGANYLTSFADKAGLLAVADNANGGFNG